MNRTAALFCPSCPWFHLSISMLNKKAKKLNLINSLNLIPAPVFINASVFLFFALFSPLSLHLTGLCVSRGTNIGLLSLCNQALHSRATQYSSSHPTLSPRTFLMIKPLSGYLFSQYKWAEVWHWVQKIDFVNSHHKLPKLSYSVWESLHQSETTFWNKKTNAHLCSFSFFASIVPQLKPPTPLFCSSLLPLLFPAAPHALRPICSLWLIQLIPPLSPSLPPSILILSHQSLIIFAATLYFPFLKTRQLTFHLKKHSFEQNPISQEASISGETQFDNWEPTRWSFTLMRSEWNSGVSVKYQQHALCWYLSCLVLEQHVALKMKLHLFISSFVRVCWCTNTNG